MDVVDTEQVAEPVVGLVAGELFARRAVGELGDGALRALEDLVQLVIVAPPL